MGKRIFLAGVFVLLTSMAFAEHAISLEPEAAPAPSASAFPKVEVALPSALDLYIRPAPTREVCTTLELGFGEIQTDCRMKPITIRAEDPALRGLCITRYGRRTCY